MSFLDIESENRKETMREIQLTGTFNIRDLGGLPTRSGRKTRYGKLYRSDGLDHLTEEDLRKLLSLGIQQDIDLRSTNEMEKWNDLLGEQPEIAYRQIPLLHTIDTMNLPATLSDLYLYILDDSQEEFKKIFCYILDYKESATLFHCSAGKDRTGLVAAILLLLVDVEEEDLIRDYCLSEGNLKLIRERFSVENDPALQAFLSARPEDIGPFLDHLRTGYGGAEGYLFHIGMSAEEIESLKAILI